MSWWCVYHTPPEGVETLILAIKHRFLLTRMLQNQKGEPQDLIRALYPTGTLKLKLQPPPPDMKTAELVWCVPEMKPLVDMAIEQGLEN